MTGEGAYEGLTTIIAFDGDTFWEGDCVVTRLHHQKAASRRSPHHKPANSGRRVALVRARPISRSECPLWRRRATAAEYRTFASHCPDNTGISSDPVSATACSSSTVDRPRWPECLLSRAIQGALNRRSARSLTRERLWSSAASGRAPHRPEPHRRTNRGVRSQMLTAKPTGSPIRRRRSRSHRNAYPSFWVARDPVSE